MIRLKVQWLGMATWMCHIDICCRFMSVRVSVVDSGMVLQVTTNDEVMVNTSSSQVACSLDN